MDGAAGSGGGPGGGNGTAAPKERAAQKPLPAFLSRIQSLPSSITSREFWSSLPVSTRLFLVWSVLDAVMVVYYSIWQFRDVCVGDTDEMGNLDNTCSGELLHILLGLLVTAGFFVVLVMDAVANENDLELLATILLSLLVTGRVLFHLFSQDTSNLTQVSGITLSIFFELVTLMLAYLSYRKFGWRVYSRVACDLRLKDAQEKRRLYFMLHRYKTLVKLDIMFLILMFVTGVVMALEENKDEVNRDGFWNLGVLGSVVIGTIVSTIWLVLAIQTVRQEDMKPCKWLSYTLWLNFLFPVLSIIFVYGDNQRDARVAKESLLLSVSFFLITRLAVWWYMRRLMAQAQKSPKSDPNRGEDHRGVTSINPDLLPLLKGSWITKPTFNSPMKRRFFQLSQDYTTLRWAWNNYVLLYHVDSVNQDDESLSLTLLFAMEPELVLKFKSRAEYQVWKRGLTLVVSMLMSPDEGIHGVPQLRDSGGRKNFADQPNAVLQKFLKGIGIAVHNRRAGGDQMPPNLATKSHDDIAAHMAKQMSVRAANAARLALPYQSLRILELMCASLYNVLAYVSIECFRVFNPLEPCPRCSSCESQFQAMSTI
ncbi:unnamed protein product [Ostreobium quekettii]|uniref:PH domain-containing protein n=1 Tax=Ostreobium quekettii TaxID=121088 RepID=A0A8S1JB10_9CHLO|nr:unnamed protein product [Ostreobium quekettii]